MTATRSTTSCRTGSRSRAASTWSFRIPTRPTTTGLTATWRLRRSDDFFTYMKDTFDMLYREGESEPRMMSLALHDRLIGRPGRAHGLAKFLDYVLEHDRVWICRGIDIARHWIAHHPAPAVRWYFKGQRLARTWHDGRVQEHSNVSARAGGAHCARAGNDPDARQALARAKTEAPHPARDDRRDAGGRLLARAATQALGRLRDGARHLLRHRDRARRRRHVDRLDLRRARRGHLVPGPHRRPRGAGGVGPTTRRC